MNKGMGWATFWPALAKVAIAIVVLFLGWDVLDMIEAIYGE